MKRIMTKKKIMTATFVGI